ncbi:MAG: DUF58 domain-containing protein [Gloeomargarita sp. SKYG116]|nr:DUF58 domain-containing protein [Gloeomargarita sp. SKYG116]MDW8401992.1 DUF58 domain-containing protein [Gloeomargarita sp. SKYGB_i_bin116]
MFSRDWFQRLPRRFTFTRVGGIFTTITVLVSIGAFNTGNNLLYLLLGMLLSLIIASGVLSEEVMKGLAVERVFPSQIFAGVPTLVILRVHNRKRRIPTFSISITDRLGEGVTAPANYFLRIDPGQTVEGTYRLTFPRRGWWTIAGYELSTRFPFDLFCKVRVIQAPVTVLVYPSLGQPPPLRSLALVGQGERPQARAGGEGEFLALRDFRVGDDVRRIHWKVSARRDRWLIRDLERQETDALTLYFYNVAPAGMEPQRGEQGIATCAGLARDLLEKGYPVALVTTDARTSWGRGLGHLDAILRVLAVVEFTTQPPVQVPLTAQDRCIVFSAGVTPPLGDAQLLTTISF